MSKGMFLMLMCMPVIGLAVPARAAEVLVFAAASLADALKEIRLNYERESPDRIACNFDASSILVRQIAAGAPADLFFSADEAKMDQLQGKNLIVESSRMSLLSNTLVAVTAIDSSLQIDSPADLASAAISRLALAEPETVPAGIYAKAYLQKKGLWDALSPKVIPALNVRAALAVVEAGNAEVAFVYKTDAAASRKVKMAFAVPAHEAPSITYPAALVTGAKNLEPARRFLEYLASPAAARVFEKYGFTVLSP